jgi:hypothetical protein
MLGTLEESIGTEGKIEMTDKPIFEVRVGERHFIIFANGMTKGFEDGDKPILIVNRIPLVIDKETAACKALYGRGEAT